MSLIARLYDFIAGTRIKSSEVDAEFNQIINLINSLEDSTELNAGAKKVGVYSTLGSNLQQVIATIQAAGSGGLPGDNTILNSMLNNTIKLGLLADLSTTAKDSFVAAVNELVDTIASLGGVGNTHTVKEAYDAASSAVTTANAASTAVGTVSNITKDIGRYNAYYFDGTETYSNAFYRNGMVKIDYDINDVLNSIPTVNADGTVSIQNNLKDGVRVTTTANYGKYIRAKFKATASGSPNDTYIYVYDISNNLLGSGLASYDGTYLTADIDCSTDITIGNTYYIVVGSPSSSGGNYYTLKAINGQSSGNEYYYNGSTGYANASNNIWCQIGSKFLVGTVVKYLNEIAADKMGNIKFNAYAPAGTTVVCDILDNGTPIRTNVTSIHDISDLNLATYPNLQVMFTLTRSAITSPEPYVNKFSATFEAKYHYLKKFTSGQLDLSSITIPAGGIYTHTLSLNMDPKLYELEFYGLECISANWYGRSYRSTNHRNGFAFGVNPGGTYGLNIGQIGQDISYPFTYQGGTNTGIYIQSIGFQGQNLVMKFKNNWSSSAQISRTFNYFVLGE